MKAMQITCNGENKEIQSGTPLVRFLEQLGLNPEAVVVELDGAILKRDEYGRELKDGASLEIIRFVGGG